MPDNRLVGLGATSIRVAIRTRALQSLACSGRNHGANRFLVRTRRPHQKKFGNTTKSALDVDVAGN